MCNASATAMTISPLPLHSHSLVSPAWQDTALKQLFESYIIPLSTYLTDSDTAYVHRALPASARQHRTGTHWPACFKLWSAPKIKCVSQKYDLGIPKMKKKKIIMEHLSLTVVTQPTPLLNSLPLIYESDASSSGQMHICFTLTQVFFPTHLCYVRWPFELINSSYQVSMFPYGYPTS